MKAWNNLPKLAPKIIILYYGNYNLADLEVQKHQDDQKFCMIRNQ